MDFELVNEIRHTMSAGVKLKELSRDCSQQVLSKVAEIYVRNCESVWWWDDLKEAPLTVGYGDKDGLALLKEIIREPSTSVFLVVTDDAPNPWPVFHGELDTVIEVISEQRLFEYFLVAEGYSWVIFDTHHNSLVITGTISGAAGRWLNEKAHSFKNRAEGD